MTVAGHIARGRQRHQLLMLDTCQVVRHPPGPGVYDPSTMTYSQAPTSIYTGRCRAVVWRGNEEQAAEVEVAVVRYRVEFPLDGSVPALARRDVLTLTASMNPVLVGTVLVLTELETGSTSTALRWVAEASR